MVMGKKHIIYIVVLIISISGCSDEFYETPPIAADTEESFYANIENIESAIVGCYSQLGAVRTIDLNYFIGMGSIVSDDADMGGSDPNDTPDMQNLDRLLHSPEDETTIHRIWGYLYKGIYFCNIAIDRFPALKDDQSESVQNMIDRRIGEARFLRALYYFMLSQAYGGVVKLDKPATNPSDYPNASRSTIKEVYELIESDLKYAITVLPEKSQVEHIGRATKGAAKSLLVKMLMFESSYAENYPGDSRFGNVELRWSEALELAQEVITSGEYRLVGINGDRYNTYWGAQTNGYRYIFTEEGDNCDESIFEIQYINKRETWIQARGNSLTKFTTVRKYFDENNISQNLGWGFHCPTQDLLDEYEPGDPRIPTIFAREGDSILVRAGTDVWRPVDLSLSPTGMALRKYEASPAQFWIYASDEDWAIGPVNFRLIRLADIYLLAAEASYKLGDETLAREYVNTIRRRARMCGEPGNMIPADLQEEEFDFSDVISERRRELAGEGHRFFDLVRWRLAEQELDGHELSVGNRVISYTSPKFDFFPIPSTEIDAIGGALQQYEGW